MYTILEKSVLGPKMHYMLVDAPLVAARAEAGQFIILRVTEKGERVPLTIADYDREKGTISLVFQEMGKSTRQLAGKNVGDSILDFLGPQGNATEVEKFGHVVVVGGGIGIAPVFPIARKMKAHGNRVTAIIGYRSKEHVFWEDRMKGVSDNLIIMTNDGSHGSKGFVTDALSGVIAKEKVDRVIAIGPAVMMKAVSEMTAPAKIPTIVSLNSLMVCGMGMCGACRVTVAKKNHFTCMDGPDFDGHNVDFTELMKRLDTYKTEEKVCLENWERTGCDGGK